MRQCPHCGAETAENARFCLHCMTSLTQKQVISTPRYTTGRWLPIAAAVLAVVVAVIALWPALTPSASEMMAPGDVSTTATDAPATAATDANTTATTATDAPATVIAYLYRDAQAGDDFSVSANLENAVVITGVRSPAADGVYTIPETLDGKRVIAIMGNAFCADHIKDTVKAVMVPASVKTIWNNAFATCYYLTDIYFFGDAVYTENNAFADPAKRVGTLTIHCSVTCTDRALRYYKDSASSYHAQYKDLSGSETGSTIHGSGNTGAAHSTSTQSTITGTGTSRKPGLVFVPSPTDRKNETTTTTTTAHFIPPQTTTTIRTTTHTTTRTTTTTTTTTTKQTTTTTNQYWWNASPSSTTEDGLPIEEITWYYIPCTSGKLSYSTEIFGESYTFSKTSSGVPVSECIIVTGFNRPTSNGIYRVPAQIDGKVVVEVNMNYDTPQQCHFNDPTIAPTVKRIYYPPDLLAVRNNTMNLCTALERIYFTGEKIWLHPNGLPLVTDIAEQNPVKRNLTIYGDLALSPFYFNSNFLYEYRPYPITYICYRISNSPKPQYQAFFEYLSENEKQLIYGDST